MKQTEAKKLRAPRDTAKPSVAEAEEVLRRLEAKRDELQAASEELAAARKAAGYAAHTGGSHELVNVTREIRANAADLELISEAIHEAANRVLIAKAFEREAADKANAAEILRVAAAFRECGNELDAAARTLGEKGRELNKLMLQLHGLGVRAPSAQQFDLFTYQALQTALGASVWRYRYTDVLPPHQRRTFAALVGGWATMIEELPPQIHRGTSRIEEHTNERNLANGRRSECR